MNRTAAGLTGRALMQYKNRGIIISREHIGHLRCYMKDTTDKRVSPEGDKRQTSDRRQFGDRRQLTMGRRIVLERREENLILSRAYAA
jgi:hypothetical protein